MPSPDVVIRPAAIEDAAAISRLVSSLTTHYIAGDCTEQGLAHVLASMSPDAIGGYMQAGYRYWVAESPGLLAGVLGIRDHAHVYHLFVAEACQRQGIARALWQVGRDACLEAGNPGELTVNASSWARPVYERFGFVAEGTLARNGVTAVRMRWRRGTTPD
jgi:GNAT superfamily N-acetyltransferase